MAAQLDAEFTRHGVGQLPIGQRVAGDVHRLVGDARLGPQDLGGQGTDVIGGGHGDGGVPAAQRVDAAAGQIDHAEGGLEQEAGEHAGGDDDPFGGALRPQQVAHVELFVEQVLRTATADDVVVDAELPRHEAPDAAGQRGLRDLALHARAANEAGAGNHRAEAAEDRGQLVGRLGDQVAFDDPHAQGLQLGQVALFARIVGARRRRAQQHRQGNAGIAGRAPRQAAQHGHAELARAQDQDGVLIQHGNSGKNDSGSKPRAAAKDAPRPAIAACGQCRSASLGHCSRRLNTQRARRERVGP